MLEASLFLTQSLAEFFSILLEGHLQVALGMLEVSLFLTQSLAEFFSILLEGHLEVALGMLEVSLFPTLVSKTLTLRSGGCAAQGSRSSPPSALQTMAKQFRLCGWDIVALGRCVAIRK
jgi:hypothetical protein